MQKMAGSGNGDMLAVPPGRRDLFHDLRRDRPTTRGIAGQQQDRTGDARDSRVPGRGKRDRWEYVQQRELELRLRLQMGEQLLLRPIRRARRKERAGGSETFGERLVAQLHMPGDPGCAPLVVAWPRLSTRRTGVGWSRLSGFGAPWRVFQDDGADTLWRACSDLRRRLGAIRVAPEEGSVQAQRGDEGDDVLRERFL